MPGSTGDGWEMDDREVAELLDLALDLAPKLNVQILIGALKADAEDTKEFMVERLEWLRKRTGTEDLLERLIHARVCGFTVCSPRGSDRKQAEIGEALTEFLKLGAPTAIYQLPQITQNEIAPRLLGSLANEFPNFILFKDTSGADRVALSGQALPGVFMTRGAERDYARWLKPAGGPYHGFLLSTANCFARQFDDLIRHVEEQRLDAARQLAARITAVVDEVFDRVGSLADGNPFTNANKAIDHFFAWGSKAKGAPSPRLHAGSQLPGDVLRAAGDALKRQGLLPEKGYLE